MKKKILSIVSLLTTFFVALIGYKHVAMIAEAGLISSSIIFCILNTAWFIASALLDIAMFIIDDDNTLFKKKVLTIHLADKGDGKFEIEKVDEVEVDLDCEIEMKETSEVE